MADTYPWLLRNEDEPLFSYPDFDPPEEDDSFQESADLVRLKNGDYQLIRQGALKPILTGPYYMLIRLELIEALGQRVPDQFRYRPTRIVRRATNQEWTDYAEVQILNEITAKGMQEPWGDSLELFHCQYTWVFVSPALKAEIQEQIDTLAGLTAVHEAPLVLAPDAEG